MADPFVLPTIVCVVERQKEWLRRHMPPQRAYSETADQPALTALTALFDLGQARQRSDSFDKCYREIVRLITALTQPQHLTNDPAVPEAQA